VKDILEKREKKTTSIQNLETYDRSTHNTHTTHNTTHNTQHTTQHTQTDNMGILCSREKKKKKKVSIHKRHIKRPDDAGEIFVDVALDEVRDELATVDGDVVNTNFLIGNIQQMTLRDLYKRERLELCCFDQTSTHESHHFRVLNNSLDPECWLHSLSLPLPARGWHAEL